MLGAFVVALLLSLLAFRKLRWPSVAEADRLLETRNGLPHQPVAVQEDELAYETPFAKALWREHQTRMAERIAALDAGLPRPDIANHDRFALRAIPALLLVVAFSFSASNNGGSLRDAFDRSTTPSGAPDLRVDAWVTPPGYTGQPPVYLTGKAAANISGAVAVPQFSEVTVRVTGGGADDRVLFKTAGNDESTEVAALDAGGKAPTQATPPKADASQAPVPAGATAPGPLAARTHLMKLEKDGTLSVDGQSWSFKVLADKPPEITFDGLPRATVTGALELSFKAKDDYGVEAAYAEIAPVETEAGAEPLYPPPDYRIEILRRNHRDAKGTASHDLTQDPLAGKRVRITLVARDGAGQTGRSPPHEMTLPSRNFSEPLAASVAEQRQVFALDRRKMPDAIAFNEALTLRADETIPNLTHYLLLQSARTRMKLAHDEASLKDTADYLWQVALGIEDGQLSDAQKKLREAQQKLSDALQRNASDSEIKQLMAELRKAMDAYMKELAERMQNMPMQPNQKSANILRQQDLQRMMDQIENLARSGNRDAAQQLLSELQRMMNNLQAGKPQQGQQQGQENSEARRQMDKLGQILRDQQKLMEETFKLDQAMRNRMQLGEPNEDGDDPAQPAAARPRRSEAAAGSATAGRKAGRKVTGRRHDGRTASRCAEGATPAAGRSGQAARRAAEGPGGAWHEAQSRLRQGRAGNEGCGRRARPGTRRARGARPGACAGSAAPGHTRHDEPDDAGAAGPRSAGTGWARATRTAATRSAARAARTAAKSPTTARRSRTRSTCSAPARFSTPSATG